MKKSYRRLLLAVIGVLLLGPFFSMVQHDDIFLLTLSFSLYMVLIGVFEHIDIFSLLTKYYNKEYYASKEKVFKYSILMILGINILFAGLVFGLSIWMEAIMHIDQIVLVMMVMVSTLFVVPVLNIISDYLKVHRLQKIGESLLGIYFMMMYFYIIVTTYLTFIYWKLPSYLSIVALWLGSIGCFIILIGILYVMVFHKKKKFKRKELLKREEVKLDVIKDVKVVFENQWYHCIVCVIRRGFVYLSIIFLYVSFVNRYGYSHDRSVDIINLGYFYSYYLVYLIVLIVWECSSNKIMGIQNDIENKNYRNVSVHFTNYFNLLLKLLLPIVITISVISGSIWMLLFGNYEGATILMMMSLMGLFLTIYVIIISLLLSFKSKKIVMIPLLTGFLLKLILTLPMINSFYRMGYDLIYGDIACNMICYFVSIVIGILFLNRNCHINFVKCFDKILTTIYENIILCVIIVLLQLKISVYVNTRWEALLVIIIYMVIAGMFYLIKRVYNRYKSVDNRTNL